MPLYEYYCSDCQTKFEALRPMSQADVLVPCKNCESDRTSRTLSLFAAMPSNGADDQKKVIAMGGGGGGCCGGGSCGCH